MSRVHIFLIALAVALFACSGERAAAPPSAPPPNPPTGPTPPPMTASVNMVSSTDIYGEAVHSFNPAAATVGQNGVVTWTNGSGVAHNVTFSGGSGAPSNIGDITQGSANRQFAATGTFSYACTNHPGMNGSVTVQ